MKTQSVQPKLRSVTGKASTMLRWRLVLVVLGAVIVIAFGAWVM